MRVCADYNYSSFNNRFEMPGAATNGDGNFYWRCCAVLFVLYCVVLCGGLTSDLCYAVLCCYVMCCAVMWCDVISFDFGSVHLTSFSTENDFSVGSAQYQWIEADLAAARKRPNLRMSLFCSAVCFFCLFWFWFCLLQSYSSHHMFVGWLFVSGHRPFLSSDESESGSHVPGAPMITALLPLFVQYGVDMVFTGHMHCYERTYPFANATASQPSDFAHYTPGQQHFVNPEAPIFIVQGNAGHCPPPAPLSHPLLDLNH